MIVLTVVYPGMREIEFSIGDDAPMSVSLLLFPPLSLSLSFLCDCAVIIYIAFPVGIRCACVIVISLSIVFHTRDEKHENSRFPLFFRLYNLTLC
jgi:hypothetical protein